MANVYSAIVADTNYWDGTTSWAGETSEANRDAKYSTRRFTTPALWESDRDGNSSSGDDEFGVIVGPWVSVDTTLDSISGWTAGINSITLECPLTLPDGTNAARHDGILDNVSNSYKIEWSASSSMLPFGHSNITVDGIQMHNTVTSDSSNYCISVAGAYTGIVIKNVIMSCADTGGDGVLVGNASATVTVENCIIYCPHTQGAGSEGIFLDDSGTVNIYNCIVYNFNDGIERDTGTVTVRNCAVFNNFDDFDNPGTISYCASDDGDGTNGVDWTAEATDWNSNFEDVMIGDFTPLNDDLPSAGIGPSSDANVPTTDIIGNSRSGTTCTIGAFEYQAAGAVGHDYLAATIKNRNFDQLRRV